MCNDLSKKVWNFAGKPADEEQQDAQSLESGSLGWWGKKDLNKRRGALPKHVQNPEGEAVPQQDWPELFGSLGRRRPRTKVSVAPAPLPGHIADCRVSQVP